MNHGLARQNFFQRFELLFWNLAIHILSGSRTTRAAVSPLVRAANSSEAASLGFLLALCGLAGLTSGYIFFIATH